jgi:small subunit ribosomal protein S8
MSRTDIVADSFTIIRNGFSAHKEDVVIPFSNIMMKACEIIKREGYIEDFKDVTGDGHKRIKVYLKYDGRRPVIRKMIKVSTPGRRVYRKYTELKPVLQGFGVAIVSTSKGLLSDKEAREQKVGGEVLGTIW